MVRVLKLATPHQVKRMKRNKQLLLCEAPKGCARAKKKSYVNFSPPPLYPLPFVVVFFFKSLPIPTIRISRAFSCCSLTLSLQPIWWGAGGNLSLSPRSNQRVSRFEGTTHTKKLGPQNVAQAAKINTVFFTLGWSGIGVKFQKMIYSIA